MTDYRINVILDPSGAARGARSVERELASADAAAGKLNRTLRQVGIVIGVGAAITTIRDLIDTYTGLQNRIRVVTSTTEELDAVTERLFQTANRARTGFAETTDLYSRLALATKDLGESDESLLQITESISKSLIVSGASAKEANNGLIQLAQGIASNRLAGDELRSVLEQLPFVADVIGKQLGKTRGELRKFGAEGGITADTIIAAFKNARVEINERFAKTIPTISQAFTILRNNAIKYVGELDKATGASRAFSATVLFLAQNLQTVVRLLAVAGATFAATKIAPLAPGVLEAVRAYLAIPAAARAAAQAVVETALAAQQSAASRVVEAQATIAQARAEQVRIPVLVSSGAASQEAALAEVIRARATLASTEAELAAAAVERERVVSSTAVAVATQREALAAAESAASNAAVVASLETRILSENELALSEGNAVAALSALTLGEEQAVALRGSLTVETIALSNAEAERVITSEAAASALSLQAAAEAEIAALQGTLVVETEALAAAEAQLAAATTAANTTAAVQAAIQAQNAALEGALVAETSALAAADVTLAAAQAEAAATGGLFSGVLTSIGAGINSVTAAIAANPIGAALVALTATVALLIAFKDEISLSGDGIATLGDGFSVLLETAGFALSSIGDLVFQVTTYIGALFGSSFDDIDFSFAGLVRAFARHLDRLLGLVVGLVNGIIEYWTNVPRVIASAAIQYVNFVTSTAEKMIDIVSAAVQTVVETVRRVFTGLVNSFGLIGQALQATVAGDFSAAAELGKKAINGLASTVGDALASVPDTFSAKLQEQVDNNLIPQLENQFEGALGQLGDAVLRGLMTGLDVHTFEESLNAVITAAEARARSRIKTPSLPGGQQGPAKPANANDKFLEQVRELKAQQELLIQVGLTNAQRATENELLRIKASLVKSGVTITSAQEDELRTLLVTTRSLQDQVDIVDDLNKRQETTARLTNAATVAWFRGALSADQYAEALRKIAAQSLSEVQKTEKSLSQENQILQIRGANNAERERTVALQRILNDLENQGAAAPTAAEQQSLESLIRKNQLLEQAAAVTREQTGPLDDLRLKQEGANLAFQTGNINAQQYAKALRGISVEAAGLGTTISDGIVLGLSRIETTVTDFATLFSDGLVNAFSAAEDALLEFTKTGQLNFSQLISGVIDDLSRLAIRQAELALLSSLFSGFGAGAGGLGASSGSGAAGFLGFASGGDVAGNVPIVVGEEGPEVFVPSSNGHIVPNDQVSVGAQQAQVTVSSPPVNVQVVNVLDPKEILSAIDTPEGHKIIVNQIRRNRNSTRGDY